MQSFSTCMQTFFSQCKKLYPSGGSRRNRSRKNVRPTTPSAQMSIGIASKNSNAMPAPSPMCEPNPMVIVGRANTVTGLARSIKNARASLVSKCMIPNARKSTAKASLIGKPVQKAGQRMPNPSLVGDMGSFMYIPDGA